MKAVTKKLEQEVSAIEGTSRVQVYNTGDGLNVNGLRIYLAYASTDPVVLKKVANDVERLVAPTVVALRDDGTLTVRVESVDYDAMPHRSFYPDNGTLVSWNRLARIHGLRRPNPWIKW